MTVRIVIEIDEKSIKIDGITSGSVTSEVPIVAKRKVGRPSKSGQVQKVEIPFPAVQTEKLRHEERGEILPGVEGKNPADKYAEYVDTPFDPRTGMLLEQAPAPIPVKKERKKMVVSPEVAAKRKLVFARYVELMKRGYPRKQALVLAHRSVHTGGK
jgi:hypothetical protein